MKGLRHPGGGADHLGIGGGARKTDQNMFSGLCLDAVPDSGASFEAVRRPAQSNLPERDEVFLDKKVRRDLRGLRLPVDFSRLQALKQVGGLKVHDLHLIGGVEHRIRNAFRHGDAGDGGHYVVQTFQMLNIDGGIDADAGVQQLLHILIPFGVAAALGVGMGQFIHQNQLGVPGQSSVQIKFPQEDALRGNRFWRELFQSLQQGHGFRAGVGLDTPGHHIHPRGFGTTGGLQHGVGFAHPGGIPEKYFQFPRGPGFPALNVFQRSFRVRPRQLQHNSTPQHFFFIFSITQLASAWHWPFASRIKIA